MHLPLQTHNYAGNSVKGKYEHVKANQKKYGSLHVVKENQLVDNEGNQQKR